MRVKYLPGISLAGKHKRLVDMAEFDPPAQQRKTRPGKRRGRKSASRGKPRGARPAPAASASTPAEPAARPEAGPALSHAVMAMSAPSPTVSAPPPPVEASRAPWQKTLPFHRQAYAAIDLGTNNCRLLIARPSGDHFMVIDAFSRVVRLG